MFKDICSLTQKFRASLHYMRPHLRKGRKVEKQKGRKEGKKEGRLVGSGFKVANTVYKMRYNRNYKRKERQE